MTLKSTFLSFTESILDASVCYVEREVMADMRGSHYSIENKVTV